MSPLARMELERYNRIRKEAKKRDRQFAKPSPLIEMIADWRVWLALALAASLCGWLA